MANITEKVIDGVIYTYDQEAKNPLGLRTKKLAWAGKLVYDVNKKAPNIPEDDGEEPSPGPSVSKPTFSPSAGNIDKNATVAISCSTSGAEIYYTTDGSEPSKSSTKYTSAITITADITIKAIAYATIEGEEYASSVATAAYVVVMPTVATPTFSPAAGEVEKGSEVTIACTTDGATIHYTTDGSAPTSSSPVYSGAIAINSTTTIKAIAVKEDYKNSAVAAASYTVNLPTCATPTFTPSAGQVTIGTTVSIASDTDGATIHYTTNGSNPTVSSPVYSEPIEINVATTIKAIAVKEDYNNSSIATANYTIPTVATPTFSPSDSQIESGTQITISCSTAGATIYYTDDGSDPSTSSTEYTGPITFTATKTFKAIAVKEGCINSSITTKAYTLKVIQYTYAGIYNNPQEPDEPYDFLPTDSDVTSEWLNNLASVNKFVATKKEYGGSGDEKTFAGIDPSVGGRVVYAYPASLGDLSSYIQNGSTQAINNSFVKLTNTVDGIEYNCYVLRPWNASTSLKYAFI